MAMCIDVSGAELVKAHHRVPSHVVGPLVADTHPDVPWVGRRDTAGHDQSASRQEAHSPKPSSWWLTSLNPCSAATALAHFSTAGPAISTVPPHRRQTRWWWCTSLHWRWRVSPSTRTKGVELTEFDHRPEVAVHRGQPDGVPAGPQSGVDVLGAAQLPGLAQQR
jgi:hypothetical protein